MRSSLDDYKDSKQYRDRRREFEKGLARRNELRAICKEKYPEMYELIMTYYEEKHWF